MNGAVFGIRKDRGITQEKAEMLTTRNVSNLQKSGKQRKEKPVSVPIND